MNICLFEKEEIGRPLSLKDERAVHILKILHKTVGDSFHAGIIEGEEGEAKITKIEHFTRKSADGKKSFDDGALYFSFEAKNLGKSLYPLKMIIGFPRPIQLKRLLRDMAGLGVCEIHLCGTDLGEKSYLSSDLANENELHKLLLEGTVQAGGTFVPKVFLYKSLDECLDFVCDYEVSARSGNSLTKREFSAESGDLIARSGGSTARSGNPRGDCESTEKTGGDKYFALDNVNPKSSLVQELNLFCDGEFSARSGNPLTKRELSAESGDLTARSGNSRCDVESTAKNIDACQKNVFAAIGSERGWSERERKVLESFGFVRCGLGSRVLRTETAATVAATLILAKTNFL